MGKFSSSVVFFECDSHLDYVARLFAEQMQKEGFDINAQKTAKEKWEISIKKGGMFKSVLGMSTALKVQIHSISPNVLVKTNIGIFAKQAIPSAITMFVLWPVILAQIWGMVKQAKLDNHVVDVLHKYFSEAVGTAVNRKNLDD